MDKKKIIFFSVFSLGALLCGVIFLLIQRNFLFIHVNFAGSKKISDQKIKELSERKNIKFYFYKDGKICYENKVIVWGKDLAGNLKNLVNTWLSFLQEVRVLDKKVFLESVAVSSDDQAFFSFDTNPLDREWSIFKKLCFFESMLKTLRGVGINFSFAFFLVKNQSLNDSHLDLSLGYPAQGFLKQYS